jgi:CheY-like chemotaxis protein
VRLVRDQRPDLVLMDVRMPRVDGIEATKRHVPPPRGGERPGASSLRHSISTDTLHAALSAGERVISKDASPAQLLTTELS